MHEKGNVFAAHHKKYLTILWRNIAAESANRRRVDAEFERLKRERAEQDKKKKLDL